MSRHKFTVRFVGHGTSLVETDDPDSVSRYEADPEGEAFANAEFHTEEIYHSNYCECRETGTEEPAH